MIRSAFKELTSLINYIQSVYSSLTDEWFQGTNNDINLKKNQVSDIDTNGIIYQNILAYVQLLNERSADITLQLSFVCTSQVTARVKTQNSIEYKIQNYKTERHEFGKIPINKCINDLFGVRIILDDSLTFEEVRKFIKETYQDKYRCINSSKFDYKAIHTVKKICPIKRNHQIGQ